MVWFIGRVNNITRCKRLQVTMLIKNVYTAVQNPAGIKNINCGHSMCFAKVLQLLQSPKMNCPICVTKLLPK